MSGSVQPAAPLINGPVEQDWQRLDVRMLAVTPLGELGGLIPVVFVFVIFGGADAWKVWTGLAAAGALVLNGAVRWLTTRYRITGEHVELRTGWLVRKERSVPRDRIRTVDLTAELLHRMFGLSKVKIGTGSKTSGEENELALNAISTAEADRLRQLLLRRATTAGKPTPSETVDTPYPAEPAMVVLSRLDARWLRFAPLTLSGLIAIGAVFGGGWQLLGELNINPTEFGPLQNLLHWLQTAPLIVSVPVVLGALVVAAAIGAVIVYLVAYWGFELSRQEGGALRVHRGLLTTRSVSIEEERLRGVELTEPLLLRAARGAKCTAIGTGLAGSHDSALLLPPAPRSEAHRVASIVLRSQPAPTTTRLRRHPAAALRRLLFEDLVITPLIIVTLAVLAVLNLLPNWPWQAALTLIPLGIAYSFEAYRNLGHALTDRYLVSRSGAVIRKTVALRRTGIIGWTVRRSFFQRRAGLITLVAVTAAGEGAYEVDDVGESDGLAFAETAVPGLLAPFLEHTARD